jgi:hypothetical protein
MPLPFFAAAAIGAKAVAGAVSAAITTTKSVGVAVIATSATFKVTVIGTGLVTYGLVASDKEPKPLPEMFDAVDDTFAPVGEDGADLVTESTEHKEKIEEVDGHQHECLGREVTRVGVGATSMERLATSHEVILHNLASQEPHNRAGAVQQLTEQQAHINSELSAMNDQAGYFPALRRANQEITALRCENKQLKAEAKVSKATTLADSSCIEELTDMVNEQHVEIESLQQKLRAKDSAENKENTPSSVSFLARNT